MSLNEQAAMDAYSEVVTRVADHLLPRVVQLRMGRQRSSGWRPTGTGSAVVFTPDGYMLTAAHVVDGADSGAALFSDGAERRVEIIGRDPLSDLAVAKVDASSESSEGKPAAPTRSLSVLERMRRTVAAIS